MASRRGLARRYRRRVLAQVRRVYPRLGLRESDVVLAAFPKSGSTWLRFLWANIVAQLELGGRTIDLHVLDEEMAAHHDQYRYGPLEFTSLPRLVKTHSLHLPRVFRSNRVVYLHRHPGDVMVSYHAFRRAKPGYRSSNLGFSEFLRHRDYGLEAWVRHVRSWLPRATTVVSYESLQEGGAVELRRILGELEIADVEQATLERAIELSSFRRTRELEERFGRPARDRIRFQPGFRFTREGGSGSWREVFDEDDLAYARKVVSGLGLGDPFPR